IIGIHYLDVDPYARSIPDGAAHGFNKGARFCHGVQSLPTNHQIYWQVCIALVVEIADPGDRFTACNIIPFALKSWVHANTCAAASLEHQIEKKTRST